MVAQPAYIPLTRTCPAKETGKSGSGGEGGVVIHGPVMLLRQSSGWPIDLTRTVMVGGKKVAEMQGVGPGPLGGGMTMTQPAIMKGGEDIGTGVPLILTRGFGAVGLACPACAQVTTQDMVSKYPGIRSPPERHY
jgi:hypothetical protein